MAENSAKAARKNGPGRPFQPGQSGNPGGRPPALLSRAILKKLTPERADKIAEELLKKAEEGDAWAIDRLWERTEGKVPNRNENGDPGSFDADLSKVDSDRLRTALKRVK